MAAMDTDNGAATPKVPFDIPGDDKLERWMCLHKRFVSDAREKEPDVVFIGDSIIAYLSYTELWNRCFAPMHALNFGIGAERTENVLWRIVNGEMESMKPKAVVLHVGTNNHGCSAEQVALGIKTIVDAIRERQDEAHILVLTLLPRGEKPNPLRERNAQVNKFLSKSIAPLSKVELVSIDAGFVQPDESISHHDMWDYLHPTTSGYEKAFEPVHELLTQLLTDDDGS